MKNITVSVDDDLYHAARVEAARRRKSLSALVREFMTGLTAAKGGGKAAKVDPELQKLWDMSDRKHARRRGSVGPLNREEIYQRGISRH
jgi:plasmid stability protein